VIAPKKINSQSKMSAIHEEHQRNEDKSSNVDGVFNDKEEDAVMDDSKNDLLESKRGRKIKPSVKALDDIDENKKEKIKVIKKRN